MIQASEAWLACGYDVLMSGKAMLTIDRSSDAMNEPSAVMTKTTTRRRRAPGGSAAAWCSGAACMRSDPCPRRQLHSK